jgi:hypothetical protein
MTAVSLVKPAPPGTADPPAAPPAWASWVDPAIRIAGFVLALLLALASAATEVFLTPLYWGGTRIPLAPVLAVAGNAGLVWFTVVVTGRRITVFGPALVWMAVMVAASTRTTAGDLVLTSNNWVGITTMIAGSVAFAGAGYRLILTGATPPRSRPTPPR